MAEEIKIFFITVGYMTHTWTQRWVTPKACYVPSQIEGSGLYAREQIFQGEKVLINGGVFVPVSDRKLYLEAIGHYGVQLDENVFLCPESKDIVESTGAINHSCMPNVGLGDSVTVVAMQDIFPEEEITLDYALFETVMPSFDCQCRTIQCRGIIQETDWQRQDLQKRYGNYFSPYVKELIRRSQS